MPSCAICDKTIQGAQLRIICKTCEVAACFNCVRKNSTNWLIDHLHVIQKANGGFWGYRGYCSKHHNLNPIDSEFNLHGTHRDEVYAGQIKFSDCRNHYINCISRANGQHDSSTQKQEMFQMLSIAYQNVGGLNIDKQNDLMELLVGTDTNKPAVHIMCVAETHNKWCNVCKHATSVKVGAYNVYKHHQGRGLAIYVHDSLCSSYAITYKNNIYQQLAVKVSPKDEPEKQLLVVAGYRLQKQKQTDDERKYKSIYDIREALKTIDESFREHNVTLDQCLPLVYLADFNVDLLDPYDENKESNKVRNRNEVCMFFTHYRTPTPEMGADERNKKQRWIFAVNPAEPTHKLTTDDNKNIPASLDDIMLFSENHRNNFKLPWVFAANELDRHRMLTTLFQFDPSKELTADLEHLLNMKLTGAAEETEEPEEPEEAEEEKEETEEAAVTDDEHESTAKKEPKASKSDTGQDIDKPGPSGGGELKVNPEKNQIESEPEQKFKESKDQRSKDAEEIKRLEKENKKLKQKKKELETSLHRAFLCVEKFEEKHKEQAKLLKSFANLKLLSKKLDTDHTEQKIGRQRSAPW